MRRHQTVESRQPKVGIPHQPSIRWIAIYCLLPTIYCLLSTATIIYGADWRNLIEEGDRLYAHRNNAGEESQSIEGAIKKYEEAVTAIPEGEKDQLFGLYLRLARAYYMFACYVLEDGDRVAEGYKNGVEYADKAIKINNKAGEAYYWRGINTGCYRDKKPLSRVGGLFGGGIKKDFQRALELDEKCVYGGPHRLMAMFQLATKDTEKAYLHASKAVEIAPDFLPNQLILAETLWKQEQKPEAVEKLKYILSKRPGILPDAIIENREVVTRTGQLLEDIKNKKEPTNWE
ncbi:MAG TPA: tetratricopeptide repeat protein [Candidatus Hypogeohydataceae bacterium YC41]